MTFLATLFNLGSIWPSTSALYLIGFFTFKQCVEEPIELLTPYNQENTTLSVTKSNFLSDNKCSSIALSKVNCFCYFWKLKYKEKKAEFCYEGVWTIGWNMCDQNRRLLYSQWSNGCLWNHLARAYLSNDKANKSLW